jgi:hypothetical protein
MAELESQVIGDHWVLPLLAQQDGQYLVRVAIAVADPQEVAEDAIGVECSVDGQPLSLVAGPGSGEPLRLTALRGITVHADFRFEDPGSQPTEIVVTLNGESGVFDASGVEPFVA